jgi:uncharacterized protein
MTGVKIPTTTWIPGEGDRPDDAWLRDVDPELLIDVGVRLFERGQGFEAHEAWEQAWKAAKRNRDADLERMLRALIKLAAAMVKVRQGNAAGVRDHAHGARMLLEQLAVDGVTEVARFRVDGLIEMAQRIETTPPPPAAVGRALFGQIPRAPSP